MIEADKFIKEYNKTHSQEIPRNDKQEAEPDSDEEVIDDVEYDENGLPNEPPVMHDEEEEVKEKPIEVDNTAQPLPQEIEEGNIEYKVMHFISHILTSLVKIKRPFS